jgi:2-methylcitrate dehydratase PrpD
MHPTDRVIGFIRSIKWEALPLEIRHAAYPAYHASGSWDAMVAMLSVLVAVEGFRGIEPLFADTPDREWIEDLGHNWQIMHLYFKPYAACRWAQPAIAAALALKTRHTVDPDAICEIRVRTFAAACALSTAAPGDTEQAQYNMAFPIAAALLHGMVGPSQVLPPAIFDQMNWQRSSGGWWHRSSARTRRSALSRRSRDWWRSIRPVNC